MSENVKEKMFHVGIIPKGIGPMGDDNPVMLRNVPEHDMNIMVSEYVEARVLKIGVDATTIYIDSTTIASLHVTEVKEGPNIIQPDLKIVNPN